MLTGTVWADTVWLDVWGPIWAESGSSVVIRGSIRAVSNIAAISAISDMSGISADSNIQAITGVSALTVQ